MRVHTISSGRTVGGRENEKYGNFLSATRSFVSRTDGANISLDDLHPNAHWNATPPRRRKPKASDVSARISFQEHRMKEAYLMNIHEILSLLKAFFAEQDPAHRIDHPPLYRCSIRPLKQPSRSQQAILYSCAPQ